MQRTPTVREKSRRGMTCGKRLAMRKMFATCDRAPQLFRCHLIHPLQLLNGRCTSGWRFTRSKWTLPPLSGVRYPAQNRLAKISELEQGASWNNGHCATRGLHLPWQAASMLDLQKSIIFPGVISGVPLTSNPLSPLRIFPAVQHECATR
ncbi:hypothetical protein T440DRAFT_130066 [Plenodomus tracheiphilus IPT5]|uniref:Uncharacterized protein n=1 Tax=Plenodomus tracheiphilus IPT5 TaxID=1408161 RepID=A0A6A7B2D6_9PLEO|nr:hypothetical protein T440DRAFT_130066 [Plenodomus tracheiphilus IPT5]